MKGDLDYTPKNPLDDEPKPEDLDGTISSNPEPSGI